MSCVATQCKAPGAPGKGEVVSSILTGSTTRVEVSRIAERAGAIASSG
jgi:hypothetical protein